MRIRTTCVFVGLSLVLGGGSAQAGGLYLSSFGTPSMGTASAGANAVPRR